MLFRGLKEKGPVRMQGRTASNFRKLVNQPIVFYISPEKGTASNEKICLHICVVSLLPCKLYFLQSCICCANLFHCQVKIIIIPQQFDKSAKVRSLFSMSSSVFVSSLLLNQRCYLLFHRIRAFSKVHQTQTLPSFSKLFQVYWFSYEEHGYIEKIKNNER